MPCRRLSVSTLWPNSGVVVLANSTASAARHWRDGARRRSSGTLSFIVSEAKAVRRPLVRIRSLAETGTAASAPKAPPRLRRASSASAAARAPSASSVAMGLNGSARFARSSSALDDVARGDLAGGEGFYEVGDGAAGEILSGHDRSFRLKRRAVKVSDGTARAHRLSFGEFRRVRRIGHRQRGERPQWTCRSTAFSVGPRRCSARHAASIDSALAGVSPRRTDFGPAGELAAHGRRVALPTTDARRNGDAPVGDGDGDRRGIDRHRCGRPAC